MKTMHASAIVVLTCFLSGCNQHSGEQAGVRQVKHVSVNAALYELAEEPDGAIGVISARESAKDDEHVVVVGCIGGSATPWVDGLAAFVLADAASLCEADGDCPEGCTKPCCTQELVGSTALVKFVDAQGKVLPADARELFGVKEKDAVVVRGRAKRDESGNLTILAEGLYIRK